MPKKERDERIIWDIARTRLDELEAAVRPMFDATRKP